MSLWRLVQCALLLSLLGAPIVSASLTIQTPYGNVTGRDMGNGVARFTLPYARPPVGDLRFANPQPISKLGDVGGAVDASSLPPQCYQDVGIRGGTPSSEDCLYTTYYAPISALAQNGSQALPILVWFHGGSGIAGGASQEGLDGSVWASRQKVIVAVPQYRLSLFGWLQTGASFDETDGGTEASPKVTGNQAMRDAIMALQQIKNVSRAMGGDEKRTTVLGQSSGATMVRSLLNIPVAQSLFNSVVLVSDPNDYGFSSIADHNELGEAGMDYLGCDYDDIACARSASAEDVLSATYSAFSSVPQQDPRISAGTPWRPMVGSLISGSPIASSNKSIILTTVQNELGSVAGSNFAPTPVGDTDTLNTTSGDQVYSFTFAQALNLIFNADRGTSLSNNTEVYPVSKTQFDALRQEYEEIGTDGVWRCSSQYRGAVVFAQQIKSSKVYLAEWQIGSTYASNAQNDYCTSKGRVCHEDDILLLFGTTSGPTTKAQQAATAEMQARIASFARTSSPTGPAGSVSWQPIASKTRLNLLVVQSSGSTRIAQTQHQAACAGTLWGQSVKFDWQLYPSP